MVLRSSLPFRNSVCWKENAQINTKKNKIPSRDGDRFCFKKKFQVNLKLFCFKFSVLTCMARYRGVGESFENFKSIFESAVLKSAFQRYSNFSAWLIAENLSKSELCAVPNMRSRKMERSSLWTWKRKLQCPKTSVAGEILKNIKQTSFQRFKIHDWF